MTKFIYHPEVKCEVRPGGFFPDAVSAAVVDETGRTQFVQVTMGLINQYGGETFLPIGIVEIDRTGRRVLVELPVEADSGANRLWVSFNSLHREVASRVAG